MGLLALAWQSPDVRSLDEECVPRSCKSRNIMSVSWKPNYRKNHSKSFFIGLHIWQRIRRNDRDLYVKILAVAHRTLSMLFCIIIHQTFKAAIHQMILKYHQKLSDSFNSNIKSTSVKSYPSFLVAQCWQKRKILLRFSQSRRKSRSESKYVHLPRHGRQPGA